jgi:hypothetical protein
MGRGKREESATCDYKVTYTFSYEVPGYKSSVSLEGDSTTPTVH